MKGWSQKLITLDLVQIKLYARSRMKLSVNFLISSAIAVAEEKERRACCILVLSLSFLLNFG